MSALLKRSLILACAGIACSPPALQAQNTNENHALTLHYDRPATYFEEALAIGNGTQGAILYGGTDTEHDCL